MSFIKENVNFCEEDLKKDHNNPINKELLSIFDSNLNEFSESTLLPETEEVATTMAGYIAKKLIKRRKCNYCKSMLATDTSNIVICPCLQLLSRGSLTFTQGFHMWMFCSLRQSFKFNNVTRC